MTQRSKHCAWLLSEDLTFQKVPGEGVGEEGQRQRVGNRTFVLPLDSPPTNSLPTSTNSLPKTGASTQDSRQFPPPRTVFLHVLDRGMCELANS